MQQAGSGGQQDRGPATLDPILVRTIGKKLANASAIASFFTTVLRVVRSAFGPALAE